MVEITIYILVIKDFTWYQDLIFVLNQSNVVLYIYYDDMDWYIDFYPSSDECISLYSTQDNLVIISATGFYVLSWFSNYYYSYTQLSCTPTNVSISAQFLSIFCEKYLIIDLFALVSANVYTEIQANEVILIAGENSMISTLFLSEDQQISIYSVGQNIQSKYIPNTSLIASSFGMLNINNITNKSTQIQLEIIASSQYGVNSTNVSVIIWNNQYLEQNSYFSNTTSSLTSGVIDVTSSDFSAIIPIDAFLGNKITYALTIDGTIILPSVACLNTSSICIENNLYEISVLSQLIIINDFWLNNDIILASNAYAINIFSISWDFSLIFYSHINFANFFQDSDLSFYYIDVFVDNNTIICTGTGYDSGYFYFIFTATFFGEVLSYYNVTYSPMNEYKPNWFFCVFIW